MRSFGGTCVESAPGEEGNGNEVSGNGDPPRLRGGAGRGARPRSPALWKPLSGLAAAAACLCLVFFGYYQPNYTAYGTLRIQINPDVEMTVSRTDRVLDLEGLNADGEDLIEGYDYRGKNRETAADELVERAIDMGYLSDGDTISVTVHSDDADWQAREEAQVQAQLEERYGATIVIQLGDGAADQSQPAAAPEEPAEVVVPVAPQVPEQTTGTAADPSADGVTDYTDTAYGPTADGVTDDDDTDYGPNADGRTTAPTPTGSPTTRTQTTVPTPTGSPTTRTQTTAPTPTGSPTTRTRTTAPMRTESPTIRNRPPAPTMTV